ncbi:MAG: hypothetical protein BWY76_02192 [bacterium ADurb.Bin429]|nr:MAG: hypothetical protein BWY76_02192 [bacterium ADurb.Bin429]
MQRVGLIRARRMMPHLFRHEFPRFGSDEFHHVMPDHFLRRVAQVVGNRLIYLDDAAMLVQYQPFRGGLGKRPVAFLAFVQNMLALPPLGDIVNRQQNARIPCLPPHHFPRIQQHHARAKFREVMRHRKIRHHLLFRQYFLQQRAQQRDIPLPVSHVVQQPAFGILRRDVKRPIKRRVRALHPQVTRQHHQRFAHRINDRLRQQAIVLVLRRCLIHRALPPDYRCRHLTCDRPR